MTPGESIVASLVAFFTAVLIAGCVISDYVRRRDRLTGSDLIEVKPHLKKSGSGQWVCFSSRDGSVLSGVGLGDSAHAAYESWRRVNRYKFGTVWRS